MAASVSSILVAKVVKKVVFFRLLVLGKHVLILVLVLIRVLYIHTSPIKVVHGFGNRVNVAKRGTHSLICVHFSHPLEVV